MKKEIVILYSGGTDSTCAAALMAEQFDTIHLLTYKRYGLFFVENSKHNAERLKAKFKTKVFIHRIINVDKLAAFIYYRDYLKNVLKHGFFSLSNCGLCALMYHTRTVIYCLDNRITDVADGINREWPFFPGHMEKIIDEFKRIYREFGITYHTPVLDLDLPPQETFLDKIRAETALAKEKSISSDETKKTAGKYLYSLGLMPKENIKGTDLDHKMQARCFQFTLHNIFVYWYYMPRHSYSEYEKATLNFFKDKLNSIISLLNNYNQGKETRRLRGLLN